MSVCNSRRLSYRIAKVGSSCRSGIPWGGKPCRWFGGFRSSPCALSRGARGSPLATPAEGRDGDAVGPGQAAIPRPARAAGGEVHPIGRGPRDPRCPAVGRLHLRRRRGLRPQPNDRRAVGLRGGDDCLGEPRRRYRAARPTRSAISRPAPPFSASTAIIGRPTAGRFSISAPARPCSTSATIWRSSSEEFAASG